GNDSNGADNNKAPAKEADKSEDKGSDKDGKSLTVTATAYTVKSAGGDGITTTGIDLNKDPEKKKRIAVDTDVITLGSVVEGEGYGTAIAGDTGRAINGKKIDVFVPTEQEATNWGVRTVKVTIK